MELSFVTNPVEIKGTPAVKVSEMPGGHDASFLASQIPFLRRNYFQNTIGIAYDFGERDMHYALMCSIGHKVRIYTTILNYGSVCLEADSPDGPWTLMMDGEDPLKIVTLTTELEEAGYSAIYLSSLVWNSANHAQNGYYRGFVTLKKDAYYETAFCKSQGGISFFDYTVCEYDAATIAKLGSYRYLMGAYFDTVDKVYYAVASGVQTAAKSGRPVFVKSTNGINWQYVGELPWLNNSFSNDEYHASCLTKIGNLWLVGISRFDYTEGDTAVKNPAWCYSADGGKTWDTWNVPFLTMKRGVPKYPGIYCTPNYIYLPYIFQNHYMCMARIEWSENPPYSTNVPDITETGVKSSGFYCHQNGAGKIVVTLNCTASADSSISFNVHPLTAVGTRQSSADWSKGEPSMVKSLELKQGKNVLSFDVENLPHIWNFTLENNTEGATISDIYLEYVKY